MGGAVSGSPLQQLVVPHFCQTAAHFEHETGDSSDITALLFCENQIITPITLINRISKLTKFFLANKRRK
jgi:hypothetical protein